MAGRKKSKVNATGRNPAADRFVRLPHRLLQSEAYRSLPQTARALLVELAMMENGRNNGSLFLSVRDAADRLGMSDQTSLGRAFEELVDRGLIRCTKEAHFEVKAAEVSRARCWRLTWLPANNRPATNEWEQFTPPPGSSGNKRSQRGLKALKRYKRQLTSDRLPVRETRAKGEVSLDGDAPPALETNTAIRKNGGNPTFPVAQVSKAHTAVTITRPRAEWWRQRTYLRLPDPYVVIAAND
jgi:hypothetical protein